MRTQWFGAGSATSRKGIHHWNWNSLPRLKLTCLLFITWQLLIAPGMVLGTGMRLNVPRIRLPYFDTFSVNFTLHVVDNPGCYKWTASRSDIIKLTTFDGKDFENDGIECSDRAVISTSPRGFVTMPASATVFAEDVNTNEIVRCDVVIDKIESIKISTTNSHIHLEEAPSKFHVRGYGSHGNEFSTMEGVPMKWWLESPTEGAVGDPRATMRFLPFSESLYEAKPGIAALEAKRLQGTEVLVEGLKTGSVIVNAKIHAPLYKHVSKTNVRIVAIANLLLDPADLVIVPETSVPIKLMQLKQGRLFGINLPSDMYIFEVENTTVAMYDPKTSTVTGMAYGETKITVRDKFNLDNELTNAVSTYIYVREPKFLSFNVKPYQNWALMIGETYTITVDVFDADNQKFYVGNNIFIKTTFDTSLFKTEISSFNGTYHVGSGIRTGSARVTAELLHYLRKDGTRIHPTASLKFHAEMDIFQRIAISPKLTVLPWDPFTSPKHEIIFKASGGNGNFLWTSSNSTVMTVTQSGHARTESYGTANITAAMTINSHINGAARVYVLLPTSMKIVDHIVEAEIGAPILIPLAFYATVPDDPTGKLYEFSTCRNLNFKVQIEDPAFVYDSKTFYPHAKPACAYLPIMGSKLGSTVVTVTYAAGERVFTDSVTVSTFKPLKVVEPLSKKTVLAIGSSRHLVFEGGPRPLLERIADFYRQAVVDNTTVAKVSEVKAGQLKDDLYIYEVVCIEVGEAVVTLEIGNSRASADRIPVRRTGDVKVICGDPAKIYFKIESAAQQDSSKCPQDLSSAQIVRIPVPNYENILVSVTVKDKEGKKFDNITSLNIRWTTSLDIVTFQHPRYIETESIQVNGHLVPGKAYQTITPTGTSGNIEISAEIVGYREEVLKSRNVRSNIRLLKIEQTAEYLYQRRMSMDLQLVGDISLEPRSTTLFNHPSTRAVLKVVQGSGYFEVSTVPEGVVDAIYFPNNKTISIKPLREGEVKIVARDLCLSRRPPGETTIQVNGVGTILVTGADKIQLSNSTVLTVQLFDKNGNSLTPEDMLLIKLRPISVTQERIDICPVDSLTAIQYKVTGKSVGVATVGFVAEGPSGTSKSEIKRFLVYAPLSVQPKQLTLLVGSVYQVLAQGGPQSDSSIDFASESTSKLAVLPSGIILGKSLGSTKVIAKAVDSTSHVVYAEDFVEVDVVNLAGIRIHTASNKLQVNEIMPVWAVGIAPGGVELDPNILFGGKSPLMTFDWSIWSPGSADIEYPFQSFGLLPMNNDQPYFRFRAKKVGVVTVRLTANLTGTGKVFTAETVIDIQDELVVLSLMPMKTFPIIMSPNSEISLKTNKHSTGFITYRVNSFEGSWNDDGAIVSVDSLGVLRSRDKIGDALVRVIYTDHATGVSDTIGYVVSVRLVVYHMITPSLSVTFTSKRRNLESIPRGMSFRMAVTYHDALGRKFHATNVIPKLRPNRFDIIEVNSANQNNTFLAQSNYEGKVGFLAFNSQNPSVKDFLFASVGEAIEPRLPRDILYIGDVVCFSCGVKSLENVFGEWSAEPSEVFELDARSGVGFAVASGAVSVRYTVPGVGLITSLDLTVKNLNRISFYGPATTGQSMITNGDLDSFFDIPVKLGDSFENLKGSCAKTQFTGDAVVAPFRCTMELELERSEDHDIVSVEKLFLVSEVFMADRGHYVCRIKPLEPHKLGLFASLIRANLVITAKLISNEKERTLDVSVSTQPLKLSFQPSLYLHTARVEVTNKQAEMFIYITGCSDILNQLKIGLSHSPFVEIDKRGVTMENTNALVPTADQIRFHNNLPEGTETRAYRVKLLPAYWSSGDFSKEMFISLISPSTNQFLEIPITVRLASPFVGEPEITPIDVARWFFGATSMWLVIVVVMITMMTLAIVHYFSKYQDAELKGKATEVVFVSRGGSPRSSTPLDQHSRLRSLDSGSMGDGSSPVMPRRLYSTDSAFGTGRYSSGSCSPNNTSTFLR